MSNEEVSNEGFFGRWSRRKRDAELDDHAKADQSTTGDVAPANPDGPAAAAVAPVAGGAAAGGHGMAASARLADRHAGDAPELAPELPSIDSLGMDSDYSLFMRADVEPGLRVSALKKLFADPHFNQMDGLDIYIDDYSKPDPIPLALLKQLNQSRTLRLFDDDDDDKPAQDGTALLADSAQAGTGSGAASVEDADGNTSLPDGEGHRDVQGDTGETGETDETDGSVAASPSPASTSSPSSEQSA